MVNIILDTQTWIYLANGYNQASLKHEDIQHLNLYSILEDLRARKKINILVNEVIVEEWHRNIESTKTLVEKNKRTLSGVQSTFFSVKNYLSESGKLDADKVFNEYKISLLKEIDKNFQHIKNVENLILKNSIKIPVSNEIRIETSKLAQQKKAPFHNKNNSVGDALILFSTIDYLKKFNQDFNGVYSSSIFISNNSDDYCDKKGSTSIHADLKPYFEEANLQFETNIGRALNLSQEIIKDIDEFNEMIRFSGCLADCVADESYLKAVDYNRNIKIPINNTIIEHYNPNQMTFDFGKQYILTRSQFESINADKFAYISFGNCEFCNALHVRCNCGCEHYTLEEENYIIGCHCGCVIEKHNDIFHFTDYESAEYYDKI